MMEKAYPLTGCRVSVIDQWNQRTILQLTFQADGREIERSVSYKTRLGVQPDGRHPTKGSVLGALIVELKRAYLRRLGIGQNVIACENNPRRNKKSRAEPSARKGDPSNGSAKLSGALYEPGLQAYLRRSNHLLKNDGHRRSSPGIPRFNYQFSF
jgi:hypothetical protein